MVRWNPRGARGPLSLWGPGPTSQMRTGTEPHAGLKGRADAWSAPATWSCKDPRDSWGAALHRGLASRGARGRRGHLLCLPHTAVPFVPVLIFLSHPKNQKVARRPDGRVSSLAVTEGSLGSFQVQHLRQPQRKQGRASGSWNYGNYGYFGHKAPFYTGHRKFQYAKQVAAKGTLGPHPWRPL